MPSNQLPRTRPTTSAVLAELACICLAPGVVVAQDAPAPFSIDDAIDLVSVGAPRLSPDGARVLYTVSELDWKENERKSRIWIADADGSDAFTIRVPQRVRDRTAALEARVFGATTQDSNLQLFTGL